MSDIQKSDIHVHVPEGATPKDGPSAGVAMITSIISSLTGNPVKHLVAMTGEMTLRGRVLPIGGLKEKLLAASRGGVKTVIIPKENEKDLSEIPDNIKDGLDIKPVSYVDEALEIALVNPLIPIVEDNAKSDKETDKGLNIEPSTSKTEITAH
jgi:ATP-dependent Lon protease